MYELGILKSYEFGVKIISVGNTSMGGSGKTPLVLWLAKALIGKGLKVGIVEKGYRSKLSKKDIVLGEKGKDKINESLIGDEAAMIWNKVTDGVRLCVSHDKTAGTASLEQRWRDLDAVIVDDAFQHLKLKRDVDVVLIDSMSGFKDRMFPYGRLRESYSSLKRANVLLFTKADALSKTDREYLLEKALKINSKLKVFFSITELYTSVDVKGKKVLPVSAIYNPMHFNDKLRAAGAVFEKYAAYADHYSFGKKDVDHIIKVKESAGAEYIVVTSKDIPKLKEFFKGRNDIIEAWYEHKIDDQEGFLRCCIG